MLCRLDFIYSKHMHTYMLVFTYGMHEILCTPRMHTGVFVSVCMGSWTLCPCMLGV